MLMELELGTLLIQNEKFVILSQKNKQSVDFNYCFSNNIL